MNQQQPISQPPLGMSLGDVYYILFRRKWLILILALCGFIGAGVAYFLLKPTYSSTAKLFVSFIADRKGPVNSQDVSLTSPGERGVGILGSEVEILNSFDIAKKVAEFVQPSRILAPYGGGTNLNQAAALIVNNLSVETPKASETIAITFTHQDASIVQVVLEQVITNYYEKQEEVHLKNDAMERFITRNHEILSGRLTQTEKALAEAMNQEGVVDVTAALTSFSQQESAIMQDNYLAEANLAEAEASAAQLKKIIPPAVQTSGQGGPAPATNNLSRPSEEQLSAYQQARQHLVDLQSTQTKLLSNYTTNNSQVKTNLIEIQSAQAEKRKMEQEIPALLAVAPVESGKTPSPVPTVDPAEAYNAAVAKIAEIQARMVALSNRLQSLRTRGTNLNQLATGVRDLERSRIADEENLKRIDASKFQGQLEGDNSGGLMPGISVIETPTPPVSNTKKTMKIVGGLAVGGLGMGLALAFALELFLDRSFKRPREVASRLKLPFFLAIPYLNGNGKAPLLKRGQDVKLLPANSDGLPQSDEPNGNGHAPTGNGTASRTHNEIALQPFYETLRDRLVTHFEFINLTHKPKLVALTSCDQSAGVSTISAGLACSLSETGDGNVLLVDMNSEEGETHRFFKGNLSLGIDDALEKESRDAALVQDNLYVVKESTNGDLLPSMLPKRFGKLVSKLKASDYDYIIFDMPPVTQISVTPRLARFMDMVLLVVEAEKTDRDVAQRAAALLGESRANVGVVMNKIRRHVPQRLLKEL